MSIHLDLKQFLHLIKKFILVSFLVIIFKLQSKKKKLKKNNKKT